MIPYKKQASENQTLENEALELLVFKKILVFINLDEFKNRLIYIYVPVKFMKAVPFLAVTQRQNTPLQIC